MEITVDCGKAKSNQRGVNNPLNSAYTNTVADYESGVAPPGDNTIEDIVCSSSVYVGAVVRMSGSTVVNALANTEVNSQLIGICISKSNSTTCSVLTCGYTGNILAGLSTGSTYYLSDSVLGGITITPPTTSGSYVIRVGKTQNTTNIIIQHERIVKRS